MKDLESIMEKTKKKRMPHASSEDAAMMPDVLNSDKWKDYLSTLAKATGFTLTVVSRDGDVLFFTSAVHPLCEAVQAFRGSRFGCDDSCRSLAADAVNARMPKIFKCSAHVMNFVLPIDYRGARIAVLGQGSFSRYSDLRSFTDDPEYGLLANMTTPMTFTSAVQTQNVCDLLANHVSDLLKNSQENSYLHNRIDSLRSLLEGWVSLTQMDPDAIYEHLIRNLSTFMDDRELLLLVLDPHAAAFIEARPPRLTPQEPVPVRIGARDSIVQRLSAGEQYVAVEEGGDNVQRMHGGMAGGYAVFPVPINGRIESLLVVAGPVPAENDVRMISAFCRQMALAIENRRQHQDIYRKFDRLATIATLTESLAPGNNEQSVLQMILDKSADLLLAEQGSLMLLDQETDALLMEATKGAMEKGQEKIRIPRGVGIAGKVAELGEPMLVADIENDPRTGTKNRSRYKTVSFVSVPLKVDQRVMGVMNFSDKKTGEVFNAEDLKLAQAFATHAAVILERKALSAQMDKLKQLSITDPLTGLLNRRYLRDRLEEELARTQRHSRPLSLMMIDLDGFKQYNDAYGHPAGDKVLEAIAVVIMHSVRTIDIVARYGGDEFVVILPETAVSMALMIGERLRHDISKAILPGRQGTEEQITLTASIGIACYPEHDAEGTNLLERADSALYRAKAIGKNRIEVYA